MASFDVATSIIILMYLVMNSVYLQLLYSLTVKTFQSHHVTSSYTYRIPTMGRCKLLRGIFNNESSQENLNVPFS